MSHIQKTLEMLEAEGAELLRSKGTHRVYKLPSGRRFTLSVSKRNMQCGARNALATLKRLVREDDGARAAAMKAARSTAERRNRRK